MITKISVSLILICVCLLSFWKLRKLHIEHYGRFKYINILQPHRFKGHSALICLFYAFCLTSSLLILEVFHMSKTTFSSWTSNGKLYSTLGIFLTLFLGAWGVVVSYNVLKQQKTQLVGFDEFLVELRDALFQLEAKANSSRMKNDRKFEVYLYDYHPLVGIFSSHNRYREYRDALDRITLCPNIDIILLTYHEDCLSSFFKRLGIDADNLIVKNSYEAISYIKGFESKRSTSGRYGCLSLWRSNFVSEYHFVIIDDTAFQYVVLPDGVGSPNPRNTVRGTKSEDPFVVNYLKSTFFSKLQGVVSYTNIAFEESEDGGRYRFTFEPQSNVDGVNVQFGDQILNKTDGIRLLKDSTNSVSGFTARQDSLQTPFRYFVSKNNSTNTISSEYIHYRELIAARKKLYHIEYIYPTSEKPKDHLSYCCAELDKKLKTGKSVFFTVFYDSEHCDLEVVRLQLTELLEGKLIPYIIVPQATGAIVAIEIVSTDGTLSNISFEEHQPFLVAIAENNDGKDFFISATEINQNNLKNSIRSIYNSMPEMLSEIGLDPKNIFRMWNYIGEIRKETKADDGTIVDNYNIFCGIREELFNKLELGEKDYPAASGVGVNKPNFYGLSIHGSMREQRGNVLNLEFQSEQSQQKLPYKYSRRVLRGEHNPLFQRGKLISYKSGSKNLFVSGIASIKGEDTYNEGEDLILGQLQRTITCLFDLLKINGNEPISLRNMSYVRIYYSPEQSNQLENIKNYLSALLHDVPHVYLRSEICRQDLLVEIEAAMY